MAANTSSIKIEVPNISGTKSATRNAQLLVSSGIPSLDHFIGGGLPIGSILLIEEDTYSIYSKVVYKYFLAEGIVNKHALFVASQDLKPSAILSDLPAVEVQNICQNKMESLKKDEMKIAWRYQNMKILDVLSYETSGFGHYYDLTKKMDKEILDKSNIEIWDGENIKYQGDTFENNTYKDLLVKIDEAINTGQFSISQTPRTRNILRIAIQSLGSRLWLSNSDEESQKNLIKFVYMLRASLRKSFAVAILTIPALNLDYFSSGVLQRLEHLSDTVISLESFSGSSRETNPVFKDYHGLLHIKKLSAFNTLVHQNLLFSDLAFKLRRKKFLIEILHLPPEWEETTQREQDDILMSNCGGTTSKNKLDF